PCQIGGDVVALEEDRRSGVAAFDRPVEVVPLVRPAHGRRGLLMVVQAIDRLVHRDSAQQRESALQDAALVVAGDTDPAGGHANPERAGTAEGWNLDLRQSPPQAVRRAQPDPGLAVAESER